MQRFQSVYFSHKSKTHTNKYFSKPISIILAYIIRFGQLEMKAVQYLNKDSTYTI